MSVEVWSIALNAKIGNPAKKAVLLGLANHASPDGKHCYPSVKRLSVYSEFSESTVRTKLAELREDKLIKVVRKSYRYRPTEYEINIKKLKTMRNSDLYLLEVSSDTPISGGTNSQEKEGQTSGKPTSDLQETDIRPPGAGGKPSLTIKEPSLKDLKDSDDTKRRPRDLLFDAIAEICCVDPKTAGSSIAKVRHKLGDASYSPEDVYQFKKLWWKDSWRQKPPTLWKLQEQIGIVKNAEKLPTDGYREVSA